MGIRGKKELRSAGHLPLPIFPGKNPDHVSFPDCNQVLGMQDGSQSLGAQNRIDLGTHFSLDPIGHNEVQVRDAGEFLQERADGRFVFVEGNSGANTGPVTDETLSGFFLDNDDVLHIYLLFWEVVVQVDGLGDLDRIVVRLHFGVATGKDEEETRQQAAGPYRLHGIILRKSRQICQLSLQLFMVMDRLPT
jgi:hypothetical protein